ncbi:MAG: glycosyltransferase [Muribaculaceae bacterium]|nr:glycosyltransferase [Muribaculaceae bacterium]
MPKISVIIPIYNVEKYLPQCLDSILAQTFTDFELILVNDGSKDRSGNICDEYAQKDSRIVVIHKENGGASSARNRGLDIAKGEWISFIDSDDYVTPNLLSNLTSKSGNDTSLIISGIHKVDENGNITETRIYNQIDINCSTDFDELFNRNILQKHNGPCAKLYSQNIIRQFNIKFQEDIISGEDTIFNYNYLIHCDSVKIVDTADYYYMSRPGSLTTQGSFPLKFEKRSYQLYRMAIQNLTAKYKIGHPYIHERECFFMDKLINSIYAENINRSQRITELRDISFETYKENKKSHSKKEAMLKFLLLTRSFYTYDFIRTLWSKFQ